MYKFVQKLHSFATDHRKSLDGWLKDLNIFLIIVKLYFYIKDLPWSFMNFFFQITIFQTA